MTTLAPTYIENFSVINKWSFGKNFINFLSYDIISFMLSKVFFTTFFRVGCKKIMKVEGDHGKKGRRAKR